MPPKVNSRPEGLMAMFPLINFLMVLYSWVYYDLPLFPLCSYLIFLDFFTQPFHAFVGGHNLTQCPRHKASGRDTFWARNHKSRDGTDFGWSHRPLGCQSRACGNVSINLVFIHFFYFFILAKRYLLLASIKHQSKQVHWLFQGRRRIVCFMKYWLWIVIFAVFGCSFLAPRSS